jgi:two-component sensor histidine kinase
VFVATDEFDSSYLTKLEKAVPLAQADTLRLQMANDLAYYWHTRNLRKAQAMALQNVALAAKLGLMGWEGRCQVTLGAILLRLENLDSAFAVLEVAKAKVPKPDLPHLYTQLGYVMERKGLLREAADYAVQAQQVGEELRDPKAIAMAYSDLSNLCWKQGKFAQGLEYGHKSETLFKQREIDDMDYSFTLFVIGNNYLAQQDYDRALDYYQRARVISEYYGFYNNLADIYISLTDLYTILHEYGKAKVVAASAIKFAKLLDNRFLLMRAWLSLGKLQNLTQHPQLAVQHLQTCLTVATESFGDKYFLHQAYKELANAYSATGDYQRANAAFLKYDQLKDSLFTAEADQRVAKLQTEFEVAQKEATIKAQQGSLAQQQRLQLLTLGLAATLVFILVGLSYNFRNKQRVNRKLEGLNQAMANKNNLLDKRNAENELLLKEIHHRVKNNLEVVSSLLELQSAQLDHPAAQAAMLASQHRVSSMGIIHQKLYQGENLGSIEMRDYFLHLGDSVLNSFNVGDRIKITCPMPSLELDIDLAVPIGLIANELLTNALKYAFVGGRPGEIQISLTQAGPGSETVDDLLFELKDNGVGRPAQAPAQGSGFGTQLIGLLARQLEGHLTYQDQPGTKVSLAFKRTKLHHGKNDQDFSG